MAGPGAEQHICLLVGQGCLLVLVTGAVVGHTGPGWRVLEHMCQCVCS